MKLSFQKHSQTWTLTLTYNWPSLYSLKYKDIYHNYLFLQFNQPVIDQLIYIGTQTKTSSEMNPWKITTTLVYSQWCVYFQHSHWAGAGQLCWRRYLILAMNTYAARMWVWTTVHYTLLIGKPDNCNLSMCK